MGCLLEGFSARIFREPMKEPYHVCLCGVPAGALSRIPGALARSSCCWAVTARVLWCNRDMSLGELRELLERHARPDLATAIDGVRICKVDYAASPESSMSGTVLAVIAQGGKRLALGDRFYDYGAGQYLVTSVDLPMTGHGTGAAPGRPTLGFGMTLEPAVIAELLLQAGPADLPRFRGTARP